MNGGAVTVVSVIHLGNVRKFLACDSVLVSLANVNCAILDKSGLISMLSMMEV